MTEQYIRDVQLTNFRCFSNVKYNFIPQINLITGLNGTGKTSIVDAIYCLAFGRSYFVSKDSYLYKEGQTFFRLEGNVVVAGESQQIVLKSQERKQKVIEIDGVKRKKMIDHVGGVPIVCIAPSDIQLVIESSIKRRSLLDKLLCQIDKQYLQHLVNYNRLLKQRNAFLKSKPADPSLLLNTLDEQMAEPATYIHKARQEVIDKWLKLFNPIHQLITNSHEQCSFEYHSGLQTIDYLAGAIASRQKDIILCRSNFGIHKDDVNFKIEGKELKYIGSQGQIKSFLFALKMAMIAMLREIVKKEPLVLLDDIFDKLDDERVMQILTYVGSTMKSQVFITDTSAERLEEMLTKQNFSYKIIPL